MIAREIENINQMDYMRLAEDTQQKIVQAMKDDDVLQMLLSRVMQGWPNTKSETPPPISEFWNNCPKWNHIQRYESHRATKPAFRNDKVFTQEPPRS